MEKSYFTVQVNHYWGRNDTWETCLEQPVDKLLDASEYWLMAMMTGDHAKIVSCDIFGKNIQRLTQKQISQMRKQEGWGPEKIKLMLLSVHAPN